MPPIEYFAALSQFLFIVLSRCTQRACELCAMLFVDIDTHLPSLCPLQNIYQWCGSECNYFERLKASEVAIDIRDNERNGRAKLFMVEEGDEPAEVIQVSSADRGENLMFSPPR